MAESFKISQIYLSGDDGKEAHDLFNNYADKNHAGNKTKAFKTLVLDALKKGVNRDSKK
jgi:hypothetical protein